MGSKVQDHKGSTPGTRWENGGFPVLSVEHIMPALNGEQRTVQRCSPKISRAGTRELDRPAGVKSKHFPPRPGCTPVALCEARMVSRASLSFSGCGELDRNLFSGRLVSA